MKTTKIIIGVILAAVIGFVVSLFLIKVLWSWIVPELFPKAVENGFIVRELSWLGALKVAIIIGILSGIKGGYRYRCCKKDKSNNQAKCSD
ncbi:MAG: hypothetical protein ABIK10_00285 [candidate division WOR-3 bacterium]